MPEPASRRSGVGRLGQHAVAAAGVELGPDMMSRAIVALVVLALVSGCASVDRAFYYPDSKVYRTPEQDGLSYEDVRDEATGCGPGQGHS